MPSADHQGIQLQSAVQHGGDGTPYVVQRSVDGRWRAIAFAVEPEQVAGNPTWKDEHVLARSEWLDDRQLLERWIKRHTRTSKSRAPLQPARR